MNKTLVVNRREAHQLLTMGDCIEEMRQTLSDISAGKTQMLQRNMIMVANGNKMAQMPSALENKQIVGSKVCIFPGEATRKAGTQQGVVIIYNSETGELAAIVDAESITHIRTAATTAVGTDLLARKDARVLALLGAGGQARVHLESMVLVRPGIQTVYVWDYYPEAARAFCESEQPKYPNQKLIPCTGGEEAVKDADIVCTVSKAQTPILLGDWLKAGAHVNAVGACGPDGRELDARVLQRGRVYVDKMEASLRDAGDLVLAVKENAWSTDQVVGEVGNILNGKLPGRLNEEEITVFESVGIAVEDLASANLIYQKARAQGMGVEVEV